MRCPDKWQLVGFIDTGGVTFNRENWALGNNTRTLSGAGVGLKWSVGNDFNIKAFYALKVRLRSRHIGS